MQEGKGRVYVGTSGWSYPKGTGTWDGIFYPPQLADRDKLAFYAQYFDTVEINSSFYRAPSPYAAKAWAEKVPADFRFSAKLWQKFTHPKMFEQATGKSALVDPSDFDVFAQGLAPLAEAGKLGLVLAQFPTSFKPDPATLDYLEELIGLIRGAGFRLAVELRHRDWTASEEAKPIRAFMEREGVAWTMIDEPRFKSSIRHVPLTSDLGYFRFHGRNYKNWWRHDQMEDRYNYLYTPGEQREIAKDVAEVASHTRETYAYYNNHYGAKAVVNSVQLELMLGHRPRAPLPEALLESYGDQLELPEAAGQG
jgi:uncharacterized protein YecE (DUF72 family)